MDALENQSSESSGNITGRNGIILTKNNNINPSVEEIINGVDDNPITITAGQAAKLDISALNAGTYAFVYDYTTTTKTTRTIYQPITVASGSVIATTAKYITTTTLDNESTLTAEGEAVSSDHIYFSKTTNGTDITTYSYVSVEGKTTLPKGLLKVATSKLSTGDGTVTADASTFVFDTYVRNDGKYAVKVIKIVN